MPEPFVFSISVSSSSAGRSGRNRMPITWDDALMTSVFGGLRLTPFERLCFCRAVTIRRRTKSVGLFPRSGWRFKRSLISIGIGKVPAELAAGEVS
jgi:hypothetical protein